MHKFNLLPPEAVKKRRRRKVNVCLLTAQIAGFLSCAIFFPVFNAVETSIRERSDEMSLKIEDEKYTESAGLALEIKKLEGLRASRDAIIDVFEPKGADFNTLRAVNETLPQNAELVSVSINKDGVEITCLTADISTAEVHRLKLLNTNMFDFVLLDKINDADEEYLYTLTMF